MFRASALTNLLLIFQDEYNEKKSIIKKDAQNVLESYSDQEFLNHNNSNETEEERLVNEYKAKLQNLLKELHVRTN